MVWRLVVGALPSGEVLPLVFTSADQRRVMRVDVALRAVAITADASVWKLVIEGVVLLVGHRP